MYSRCVNCQAILPLGPAELVQAGGKVRCGGCGKTFDALANLYTGHAGDGEATPVPTGAMPPLLAPLDASPESDPQAREPGPKLNFDLEPARPPDWARALWPALSIVLLIALVIQVAGPEPLRLPASVLPGVEAEPPPPDPNEAIQILSRDLHPHPSLDDAVIISAVLANRSEQTLKFPRLEIQLFDASQQLIGVRRLEPADYLADSEARDSGLGADVLLPVVLELVVEASAPTGFQFRFY